MFTEYRYGCPPGQPRVNCLIRPCRFATCRAVPNARCRDNYCGGCKAEFYQGGKRIDCRTGCPVDKPQANCGRAPCSPATKCRADPTATCKNNYCGGCNAEFYNKAGKKINCRTGCPVDKPLVHCFARPCDVTQCRANPNATCIDNYCGGCNAEFFNKDGKRINCNTGCPVDKPQVNCDVAPCSVTECRANPTATCKDNYCGGCNAEFYNKDGKRINCRTGCPVDKPLVYCFARPCDVTQCRANPNATCKDNYCGGCNAEFFNKDGKKINCNTGCPVDKPQVNCGRAPCSAATKCRADPTATCKNNYCGGCNADFFNKDGKRINCNTGCPISKPLVYCAINPCRTAKCEAYPDAKCVPNYCGGCFAEFYDAHGNRVNCKCPSNRRAFKCGRTQPCHFTRCPKNPAAPCRRRACGQCKAEFFDANGIALSCRR